jgi:mRNA interferase HicA
MVASFFVRAKHTIYVDRAKGKASSVPRHKEINDFLVVKICRDLEIPDPKTA